MNALTHGALAETNVIFGEDEAEFERMVEGLTESFRPVGGYEQILVERVAGGYWRLRRLRRYETETLSYLFGRDLINQLAELREITEAAAKLELAELETKALAQPPAAEEESTGAGEEQQDLSEPLPWALEAHAEISGASVHAVALAPSEPGILRVLGREVPLVEILDKFSRYERSLESSIHRDVHELQQAQGRRGEQILPVIEG